MTIKINLKIFLFLILFYITKQIKIYTIIMIFACLHEMGHLICGLMLGLKPKSLKIMPFGLCIEFSIYSKSNNIKITIKKMIIALAGPFTNLILICISILIKQKLEYMLYNEIVYANFLIAIFNLLPIYPLDGGRFLKAFMQIKKGRQKAYNYINKISNITIIIITMLASIGIYYYRNIAILFIVIYLWGLVIIENKRYNIKNRVYKIIQNS